MSNIVNWNNLFDVKIDSCAITRGDPPYDYWIAWEIAPTRWAWVKEDGTGTPVRDENGGYIFHPQENPDGVSMCEMLHGGPVV